MQSACWAEIVATHAFRAAEQESRRASGDNAFGKGDHGDDARADFLALAATVTERKEFVLPQSAGRSDKPFRWIEIPNRTAEDKRRRAHSQ